MHPILSVRRLVIITALISLVAGLTGCVSSGYRRTDNEDIPPAVPLGWQSGTAPVDLTLQTVIVYRGPGSWKTNAYFDEYVVTLRNHSSSPQAVTRALLTDFRGSTVLTGDNPWTLEKLSRTKLDRYGSLAAIGAGTSLASFGAGVGTLATLAFAPAGLTAGLSLGSAFMLASGAIVAVPVATVYKNVSSKHGIEAEFTRRQLRLPLTLTPGQELSGSLFFPVTPGPRRLQVQLEGQSLLEAIELPLPQLATLHLAPDRDAIPLQPMLRNGRHYLTLQLDTALPNGRNRRQRRTPWLQPRQA